MPYRLAFIFLLSLCASCTKTTEQYQSAIVCDFPTSYSDVSWLVVTDDDGNILKAFSVPAGSSQLVETFDLLSRDAPDSYNVHLVNTSSNNLYTNISSYYGVKNGASVSFSPTDRFGLPVSYSFHNFFITGIDGVDSVAAPSISYYFGYDDTWYNASEQTAKIFLFPANPANLFIRVREKPSAPFRSIYMPNNGVTYDSIFVNWSDFLPESNFINIELPSKTKTGVLEVAAVEPDYKRYVALTGLVHLANDSSQQQPGLIDTHIALPNGLNSQAHFQVHIQQDDFTVEKMFQPGEPLRMETPGFSIKSAQFSPFRSLQIRTTGAVDMIEASTVNISPSTGFQWTIHGPPESFQQLQLPDLTRLIPDLFMPDAESVHWQVNAYQYAQLDYTQLLAGFPYKGGDGRVFPIARAGLQKVTKNY